MMRDLALFALHFLYAKANMAIWNNAKMHILHEILNCLLIINRGVT